MHGARSGDSGKLSQAVGTRGARSPGFEVHSAPNCLCEPPARGTCPHPLCDPPVPAQGWWLLRKPRPGEDQTGLCPGTQEGGSSKGASGKGGASFQAASLCPQPQRGPWGPAGDRSTQEGGTHHIDALLAKQASLACSFLVC